MANTKKRNHYITRKFLEGFCDNDGRVWTYPKDSPSDPFANRPGDTAVINKLYHLQHNENITAVEDYFSDKVETPASNALTKLLNKKFPNAEEKEKLSLFWGLQMVRTPSYINHLNIEQSRYLRFHAHTLASNKEHFYESYKRFDPNLNEDEIEEVRQSMLTDEYTYKINNDYLLKIMLDLGSIIASHLLHMKWALIESDSNNPFIVSDNFMHIYHPKINDGFYKIGLGIKDVCVHIPISNTLSLMLVNNDQFKEGIVFNINNPPVVNNNSVDLKKLIESFNKSMFIKCYKYVFANSDSEKLKQCFHSLLEMAKEFEKAK
ncbi:DUF4238 domain-containing protein [Legionella sp. 227]|uniref:DUF4238 domain-containing protein n=1 Tax=Legionella sp. 227 TaxID=3367288 RepID=UPI00370D0FB4